MGATTFGVLRSGESAREAFDSAVSEYQYEYGHRGYTGTIAEKSSFVEISIPVQKPISPADARLYADRMISDGDGRVSDKWGPAGCIDLGDGRYYFFGWASE